MLSGHSTFAVQRIYEQCCWFSNSLGTSEEAPINLICTSACHVDISLPLSCIHFSFCPAAQQYIAHPHIRLRRMRITLPLFVPRYGSMGSHLLLAELFAFAHVRFSARSFYPLQRYAQCVHFRLWIFFGVSLRPIVGCLFVWSVVLA